MTDGKNIMVTREMIAAGVAVYESPGRYESQDDFVVRLFCAMAGLMPNARDSVQVAPMRCSELIQVAISHGHDGPSNDALADGPNSEMTGHDGRSKSS